jgi:ribosomal protein S3
VSFLLPVKNLPSKKKKNDKMGQKSNGTIIRLNINDSKWQSKYIAKNSEETSLYVYQNVKIKEYVERMLNLYGLQLHHCQLYYSNEKLDITISYYTSTKSLLLIHKINKGQKLIFVSQEGLKKLKRKKIIKLIKTAIYKKIYSSYNYFKMNNFTEVILEGLNKFTKKKYNIFINFQTLNKSLSLRLKNYQIQLFRKLTLNFRRYNKFSFFKEMINILIIAAFKKNSSKILGNYIALSLSKMKRHNNFLRILKQVVLFLINSKLAFVKGMKLIIGGRFNGAPRSRHRIIQVGRIPLQTLKANINHSKSISFTPNGTFGIKTWIYEN